MVVKENIECKKYKERGRARVKIFTFYLFRRVKFANLIKLADVKQPWRIFQIKIQDPPPPPPAPLYQPLREKCFIYMLTLFNELQRGRATIFLLPPLRNARIKIIKKPA